MSKVALVTGGTRGIGAAISHSLKQAGYIVAANYAGNEQRAAAFTEETGIPAFKWDVSDEQACRSGIQDVQDQLGPIAVLVNNAGITRDAMMHKMTGDMWREVINTNLNSLFYMTQPVLEGMRQNNFGRVISISSINGQKGQMGQTNYSAAKAGVIGFTKALAQETARKGITVNCIAPGYIDTDMVAAVPEKVLESIIGGIPVGRLGTAEEIGSMVTYLASDQAGFITGATMTVNGGQYIA
ncbi:MAG: acetoacetyl-CoA reductase [Alphaproteobacteria bacterium]